MVVGLAIIVIISVLLISGCMQTPKLGELDRATWKVWVGANEVPYYCGYYEVSNGVIELHNAYIWKFTSWVFCEIYIPPRDKAVRFEAQ